MPCFSPIKHTIDQLHINHLKHHSWQFRGYLALVDNSNTYPHYQQQLSTFTHIHRTVIHRIIYPHFPQSYPHIHRMSFPQVIHISTYPHIHKRLWKKFFGLIYARNNVASQKFFKIIFTSQLTQSLSYQQLTYQVPPPLKFCKQNRLLLIKNCYIINSSIKERN